MEDVPGLQSRRPLPFTTTTISPFHRENGRDKQMYERMLTLEVLSCRHLPGACYSVLSVEKEEYSPEKAHHRFPTNYR